MKDEFPIDIVYATKNPYLTNTLEDSKKFFGYLPYNEKSNTYFNNGTFLLAMFNEYGYEVALKWLTIVWGSVHLDGRPLSYLWEFMFKKGDKV